MDNLHYAAGCWPLSRGGRRLCRRGTLSEANRSRGRFATLLAIVICSFACEFDRVAFGCGNLAGSAALGDSFGKRGGAEREEEGEAFHFELRDLIA